jgi:CRP-like cAMP-binding protein
MVSKSSAVPKQQLSQQLTQSLGQTLLEPELANCCKQIEILEPTPGKRFWQAVDAGAGIYIILAGKVRLLDSIDNLVTSLGAGSSFGELTLFPRSHFSLTLLELLSICSSVMFRVICCDRCSASIPTLESTCIIKQHFGINN